jgi:hypothetical protein
MFGALDAWFISSELEIFCIVFNAEFFKDNCNFLKIKTVISTLAWRTKVTHPAVGGSFVRVESDCHAGGESWYFCLESWSLSVGLDLYLYIIPVDYIRPQHRINVSVWSRKSKRAPVYNGQQVFSHRTIRVAAESSYIRPRWDWTKIVHSTHCWVDLFRGCKISRRLYEVPIWCIASVGNSINHIQ